MNHSEVDWVYKTESETTFKICRRAIGLPLDLIILNVWYRKAGFQLVVYALTRNDNVAIILTFV